METQVSPRFEQRPWQDLSTVLAGKIMLSPVGIVRAFDTTLIDGDKTTREFLVHDNYSEWDYIIHDWKVTSPPDIYWASKTPDQFSIACESNIKAAVQFWVLPKLRPWLREMTHTPYTA